MVGDKQNSNVSDVTKDNIRKQKVDYSRPYDEFVTYQDIIEKDVLDLMGFSQDYPQEKRDEMHEKINSAIIARVAEQILDKLFEDDRKTYDQLMAAEKNQEAYDFLKERGVNPEEIVTTEVIIMKLELYEDSKIVREDAKKILAEEDQKGSQK